MVHSEWSYDGLSLRVIIGHGSRFYSTFLYRAVEQGDQRKPLGPYYLYMDPVEVKEGISIMITLNYGLQKEVVFLWSDVVSEE